MCYVLSKYFTQYLGRTGTVYLYYHVTKRSDGLYGVMIEKITHDGISEVETSKGISEDRSIVDAIARILCRNSVTPCVLNEIINDLTLQQISYLDYQENKFVG